MSGSGTQKPPEKPPEKPPPVFQPTQPQGPGNTGGNKRRVEHLQDVGLGGPFRLWSCYSPSAPMTLQ